MKVLVYTDASQKCRIVRPQTEYQQSWEREEEALARLHQSCLPSVVEFLACDESKIPSDRTFREAWYKGDTHEPIKVDIQKAMQIHRERLKVAAGRKVEQLRLELQDAITRRNLPEQVAIRRTIPLIENLPNMNMTHCKTINDIKYCVPKELRDVWTDYPLN